MPLKGDDLLHDQRCILDAHLDARGGAETVPGPLRRQNLDEVQRQDPPHLAGA